MGNIIVDKIGKNRLMINEKHYIKTLRSTSKDS